MKHERLAYLVECAKQGDENAFGEIYKEFSKSVYYTGLQATKNEEDAQDVVQETMLKLYMGLESISKPKALAAYVSRVAYNRCMDIINQKAPTQQCNSEDIEVELMNIQEENIAHLPTEYWEQQEQRAYVIGLIDELSDAQRIVVMLYYYNQFTAREIAEMLELNEAAVENRLKRARAALRVKMEKDKDEKALPGIMPMSMLTQILEADAAEVFTTEISAQIWHNVATQLGYSAETIAATTPIATGAVTGTNTAAVAATTAGTATGGAAVTGTAAVTATLLGGKISALTIIILAACAVVAIGGGALIYSVVASSQERERTVIRASYIDSSTTDELEYRPDDLEPGEGASESDTSDTPDVEGATTPSSPPDRPITYHPHTMPDSAQTAPSVTAQRYWISYPAGAAVTPQQIIAEAGIKAVSADGKELNVHIDFFSNINFNVSGNYAVFARAVDGEHEVSIAIIVSVSK